MAASLECGLGQHDGCASGGQPTTDWRSWCECPCHGKRLLAEGQDAQSGRSEQ